MASIYTTDQNFGNDFSEIQYKLFDTGSNRQKNNDWNIKKTHMKSAEIFLKIRLGQIVVAAAIFYVFVKVSEHHCRHFFH